MQQLAKLKLAIATQLASKRGICNKHLKYSATYIYKQQMMPRLPSCLFKFIQQKQPPDTRGVHSIGRQLATQFISDKIHKEIGNLCVKKSLFQILLKETLAENFSKETLAPVFL